MDWKKTQRVRFWIENFTTRQIFKKNIFFKKHDFDEKINFKQEILEKNVAHKKSRFDSIYPVNCACFAYYVQFYKARFWREKFSKKHDFECKIISKKQDFEWKSFCKKHDFEIKVFNLIRFGINSITMRQILSWNIYDASDFESTFLQCVRFWIKNFTSCQTLSVLLLQFAKFPCVYHNRPRFRNVLRYGVGSVSQIILLG